MILNLVLISMTPTPMLVLLALVCPWAQLPFKSKRWRITELGFALVLIAITVAFFFILQGDERPSFNTLEQDAQTLLVGFSVIMFGISKAAALIKNRLIFGVVIDRMGNEVERAAPHSW
ncbi:hypothetical protein HGP28_18285 [Vibrio sp. SM6]|uniref:Uncharacterized protein n=1 Tax=Vibrio agarilyticus TaxID=2726741 RepID=A0A7X8TTV1_9VIBR|nr:hypothetical protein [Vibrio agarilyticus]